MTTEKKRKNGEKKATSKKQENDRKNDFTRLSSLVEKKKGEKSHFLHGLVYSHKINCQQGHKVVSTIFPFLSLEGSHLVYN